MPSFEAVKASYRSLWNGMEINSDKIAAANVTARRILSGKERYKTVEIKTGVPWFFVGLCHLREGNLSFSTYLGNGQPISQVTTIVPKGRGPFSSFEDGAIDALKIQGLTAVHDWSFERIAYSLEGFNGYGYRSRGVNSPYLWAGTNRYVKGKFVADHVFDPNVVDKQLGTMAILSRMCAMDADVNARVNGLATVAPPPPDIPKPVPPAERPVPPPATQKQVGALAVFIAALGSALAYFQAHPTVIGGAVFLVILAFIAWRVLRK